MPFDRPVPLIALTVLSVVVLLYSLVIAGQILLGVLAIGAIWLVYLLYRLVVRLGRIASALEKLVEQRADEL